MSAAELQGKKRRCENTSPSKWMQTSQPFLRERTDGCSGQRKGSALGCFGLPARRPPPRTRSSGRSISCHPAPRAGHEKGHSTVLELERFLARKRLEVSRRCRPLRFQVFLLSSTHSLASLSQQWILASKVEESMYRHHEIRPTRAFLPNAVSPPQCR